MVMQAMEGREDAQDRRPPMATWTQEVEKLTTLIDAVNFLTYVTRSANQDKTATLPKPSPRPRTAFEKASFENRKQKHDRLAARLLPHKAEKSG